MPFDLEDREPGGAQRQGEPGAAAALRRGSDLRALGAQLVDLGHLGAQVSQPGLDVLPHECDRPGERLGSRPGDPGVDEGVEHLTCLLYTSDAADERSSVDPGGRGIIKKKNHTQKKKKKETMHN